MLALLFLAVPSLAAVVRNATATPEARLMAGPNPGLPTDPNVSPYCTWFIDNFGDESCDDIPLWWGITMADFVRWNPSVTLDCGNYQAGRSYCVEAFGEPPVPTEGPKPTTSTTRTPTTTTSPPPTTTTSNGIQTPQPIQDGMVNNCDAFHLVVSGDGCTSIASKYGITLAQFYSWNPDVGSNCNALWLETNVCVSIVGHEPTPTQPGNGITTPEPWQPGMVGNCDAFYKVKSGDACGKIASANGISVSQLVSWNPEIGSGCNNMWLDTYLCVSIVGHTPSPSPTNPGNGITTPEPWQPGMVGNCDAFHKVKSGDSCGAIASSNRISVSQLVTWNPEIGSGCNNMWLDTYLCVSIVGHTPSPTTPGNGITTPSPIQPGMVGNCDAFYKVKSGDTCGAIATSNGISISQLTTWNTQIGSGCNNMWLDTYICISIIGHTPTKPPSNGVTTPTPTQSGMVGNCKTFYKIKSGDTCASVAQKAGVPVATFINWNKGVGASCSSLWLDTYYCIGLI